MSHITVSVTVNSDFLAITLYKKLGYQIKELAGGYYRSHEDCYLMVRKSADNPLTGK